MAEERTWKDKAYDYLENEIKYAIFDSLYYDFDEKQSKQMDQYMSFLEEESRTRYFDMEAPTSTRVNEAGEMMNFEGLVDAYISNLNVDWVIKEPNGLEIALKGAKAWVNFIALYFG